MPRPEKSGARAQRSAARRHRWSTIERELRTLHGPLIAGMDEVGRGPLAGPVVACAVIMPPDVRAIAGVDDSKRLTVLARRKLAVRIRERAVAIGVGAASVREIDRLNIYHASVLAMRRALSRLGTTPNHVVVDGKAIRTLAVPHTAVVGGDHRCYNVACASIIAKVTRDRVMQALAARYQQYRWERNVGYATSEHIRGLNEHGATPHHRRSFMPVGQLSLDFGLADLASMDDSEIEELESLMDVAIGPNGPEDGLALQDIIANGADIGNDARESEPRA